MFPHALAGREWHSHGSRHSKHRSTCVFPGGKRGFIVSPSYFSPVAHRALLVNPRARFHFAFRQYIWRSRLNRILVCLKGVCVVSSSCVFLGLSLSYIASSSRAGLPTERCVYHGVCYRGYAYCSTPSCSPNWSEHSWGVHFRSRSPLPAAPARRPGVFHPQGHRLPHAQGLPRGGHHRALARRIFFLRAYMLQTPKEDAMNFASWSRAEAGGL